MKVTLTVIAFFIAIVCFANMASPIIFGTKNIAPVTSRNIDITRELLIITPAKDFETALISADYFITTDTAGLQVPLLFVAADYADSMAILVDGIPVQCQNVPLSYIINQETLPFRGFDNQVDSINGQKKVRVTWEGGRAAYYALTELQYFEANLAKGRHTIHVQYAAKTEINRSRWIRSYTCNYYLSPAKNWKSFGGLDVVIDKRNCTKPFHINLGKPGEDSGAINKWHFDTIPADVLEITYKPKPGAFASALITLSPLGLAIIAGLILIALQVWLMIKYRRNKLIYRVVYYTGTFAIPLIFYFSYFSAFDLIDAVIGDEAAAFHGYTFIFGFSYILVAPAYAGISYLINDRIKRKTAAQQTSTAG